MIKGRKVLAIIPARGGSKRLPDKNIKILSGKPLIHWTIEAAQACSFIDTLMVNTDSQAIADSASLAGLDVPFMRPLELATDTSSTVDVLLDTLDWYRSNNEQFDILMLLQPTSPLRTTEDICGALRLFVERQADSVISVCPTEHSPLWANVLPEDHSMNDFIDPKLTRTRSQDLPVYYRLNGAIYIIDVKQFMQHKSLFLQEKSFAYIMDAEHSIDIDNWIDFKVAEALNAK